MCTGHAFKDVMASTQETATGDLEEGTNKHMNALSLV
jgi:hypothetical protein